MVVGALLPREGGGKVHGVEGFFVLSLYFEGRESPLRGGNWTRKSDNTEKK